MAMARPVESPVVAADHRSLATFTGLSSNFTLCKRNRWLGNFPIRLTGGGGRRAVVRERISTCPRRGPVTMAALGGLLGGIFGTGTDTGEATRKLFASTVAFINEMEAKISSLSDSQLRERTSVLQERTRRGDSLDSLLPEAFSVVRGFEKGSRPSSLRRAADRFIPHTLAVLL